MNGPFFTQGVKMGTAVGTLTVLLSISTADIVRTIVLAAIGALVSFGVSLLLKKIVSWKTRRQ